MSDYEVVKLLQKIDRGYKPNNSELLRLSKVESFTWDEDGKMPGSISYLTGLKVLNASRDSSHVGLLKYLPDEVGKLDKLEILDLNGTNVSELPKSIGNMASLRRLDLSSTGVQELPESIGKLNQLQTLYLNRTPLQKLPESIGQLSNLRVLNLSRTQINRLPESIGDLGRLQSLYLAVSPIRELPESIGKLRELKELHLSESHLTGLPESIGKLTSLQHIDLRQTRINELPEIIGKLPKLETLLLENLTLSELPESLLNLHLYYKVGEYGWESGPGIYISGLNLKNQPIEIFSRSRELIIEYYKSRKISIPINECKVVFLGDGGAGKSLMIDRLMHDGNISPEFNGESTPGICINSEKYLIGNDEIELHFWDFGGQAIMHSMHRLFLTNRTLYVVVANARDNKANEQAWYWIRNIRSFANGAPILLFINQKDQNPSANVNLNGLRAEYSNLKGVGIISALKDTREEFNNQVRDVICRVVSGMDTVHTPFAKSWLSLMNDLQKMPENYITSNAFYAKCKANSVEMKKELLDQIIGWYKDLGVCFYSKTHPVTAGYMILKPRWLLNALYILIFNGRKYAANGIINETDIYTLICKKVSGDEIKKVWHSITYNPHEIQYIINVLLDFELIYRLDGNRFFIPMLCDENEPENMDFLNSEETFHVSFRYMYLPENVLHRLMVRHGYELKMKDVWRTGAVFVRKECGWSSTVRIKDNCLDIYAKADNQKEHPVNSYLTMIRESVYKINEDFGLTADEYIAYRKDGKEDNFPYETLVGSKEAGQNYIYSRVFGSLLNIDEILGIIRNLKDELEVGVIGQMLSVLADMSERGAHLAGRGEVELTADLQTAIAPVLNAKYGIQIAREYTLGRAKTNIGESDLYFFRCRDGVKEDLYILENKRLEDFGVKQYGQLMGYLNPNFSAGITLSINKKKGWEEAYDVIYKKLDDIRSAWDAYAPISVERISGPKGTQYIRTVHVVPETGLTMPVYHLVLQLFDETRKKAAHKSRR